MSELNRLVEIMSDVLIELQQIKTGQNQLREELKGEIVALRKEAHETNRNVAKALKDANRIPDLESRLEKLEKAVFKV